MSKRYKRKDRVDYANRLNTPYNGKLEVKKPKKTKKEILMLILGIIFLVLTSPYILVLMIGVYFNSERCFKLADKYMNLKIFN